MLFHEVYGAYFSAVSEILRRAVYGELTPELMKQICDEKAFSESFLKIIPALNSGEWQLLSGLSTPLKKSPDNAAYIIAEALAEGGIPGSAHETVRSGLELPGRNTAAVPTG